MPLRTILLATAAVLASALFVALVDRFWFVCDDAYIAFTYSKNLADGHGLVWHPGGEPIEGFSDPLWVLLMALVRVLSFEPVTIAPWISAACGAWLVAWVSLLLLRRVGLAAATGAVVLLGTLPAMAVWSTSGLETMPAALCTFVVFAALLGEPDRPRPRVAGICAAVLALLRPEGLPLVGLWLVVGAVRWRQLGQPRKLGRALVTVAVAVVLAAAGWLLFRVGYFSDWVPNTVHAKGGFHWFRVPRGIYYIVGYLLTFPGLLIALALIKRAWSVDGARDLVVGSSILILSIVTYSILVGGDFMPMGRFLVPALPFVAILFGIGIQRLHDQARLVPLGAAIAGVAVCNVLPSVDVFVVPEPVRQACHFRGTLPRVDEMAIWRQLRNGTIDDEILAKELQKHTKPGQKLIRAAIGVLGYRTDLEILDSFALVMRRPQDDHVLVETGMAGHDRFLPWQVFLRDKPHYINAHIAKPDDPIIYGLLTHAFPFSPLAQMVEVDRYPLAPEHVRNGRSELRLLRFVRHDLPTDSMAPLLEAARNVTPADHEAVTIIEASLPPGKARKAVDASLLRLLEERRIANIDAGVMRFSHTATPSPLTFGYAVDASVQSGPAPAVTLPRGKFVYAVPLSGNPTIQGVTSGWLRVPPTEIHIDEVKGGAMLLIHLIPNGESWFTR